MSSIFDGVTLGKVISDRGLDEAALVAEVKASHDRAVAADVEHAKLTGGKPTLTSSTLAASQVNAIVMAWLPDDLDGLASYITDGLIAHVGEDAGQGAVPEVAVTV